MVWVPLIDAQPSTVQQRCFKVSQVRAGSANRNLVSEPPRINLYCAVNRY